MRARLYPEKAKISYCKNDDQRGNSYFANEKLKTQRYQMSF